MRKVIVIGLVGASAAVACPTIANASTRYCGHFLYRSDGLELGNNVYILAGTVGCTRARSVLYEAIVKEGEAKGWKCNFDDKRLLVTCRERRDRIRATTYNPSAPTGPGLPAQPGYCQDVPWALGEYATAIIARATGCHEAQQLVLDDMQTPACVSDCDLNEGLDGSDQFECTPVGDAYGADQDEQCVTYDGGPMVTFTIVNGV